MKVKCLYNTGESLRQYEYKSLEKHILGRFGTTEYTAFEDGGLTIGEEYLVMGIIIFETYQGYLIDYGGLPTVKPCQLFEIIDNTINPKWHFRLIDKDEDIYPFVQSIFGYPELCFDKRAYENLIVEMEEEAQQIYFRRKIELEKKISDIS